MTDAQFEAMYDVRQKEIISKMPDPWDVPELRKGRFYVKFDARRIEFTPQGAYYLVGALDYAERQLAEAKEHDTP